MPRQRTTAARGGRRAAARGPRKNVPHAQAHVHSTFNNTIITITDLTGNTLAWGSAGQAGFKGSRKSTPYAAQLAAQNAARGAMEHARTRRSGRPSTPGPGREPAVRSLQASGLRVRSISDVTPIPHNGCRPPKRRRV